MSIYPVDLRLLKLSRNGQKKGGTNGALLVPGGQ
jgi:hypothetical protein